jgi:hypothetical protein
MNPSDPDSELVSRAMDDFFRAMELRTVRNVRVAKRVTVMIRVGAVGFALLGVLMGAMIWAFTDRVHVMTGVLSTMRMEFGKMSDNMAEMRETLDQLQKDMTSFTAITNEMHVTRQSVSAVNTGVQEMGAQTAAMSNDFALVTRHVGEMTRSFRLLAPSVAGIGANVDQGAGPAKTFNNWFPFRGMLP